MNNWMTRFTALAAALILVLALTGCGSSDKIATPENMADGTYSARSSDFQEDEDGNGAGYGQVELTIKDNKITACSFSMHELDGTLKDETYGSDMSKENRLKAQKAVQSADKYAAMLVEKGSLEEVDAISGATICYNEFVEAVTNAMNEAAASE